jgi:hypothetical protein
MQPSKFVWSWGAVLEILERSSTYGIKQTLQVFRAVCASYSQSQGNVGQNLWPPSRQRHQRCYFIGKDPWQPSPTHGPSRCNNADWLCSVRNSSLWTSHWDISAWVWRLFRWGTVMSDSIKGPTRYTGLFASTRSRPTVQSTYRRNKTGPKSWSISADKNRPLWFLIWSVRPRSKTILKSWFDFRYVLLRRQICIPWPQRRTGPVQLPAADNFCVPKC